MATIITRASKGSALTNAELDSNLTNLNTEITARASATNITGTVTVPSTTAVTVTTNSMPSIRPSLQLDFVNNNRLDSRVTFTRASTATRTNARGILETVAVNAPRFDYDSVTLACRGLLIEESRTNQIRNNTMQGAVAGTPGTAPTNWSTVSGGGISQQIVSAGTEAGISYIDVRFFGTGSSVAAQRVYLESTATVPAATGQSWTLSAYVKLVSGTAPAGLFIGFDETGPGTTYIRTDQASLSVTGALLRYTYSVALAGGANVAFLLPQIGFNSAVGVAVDFTLRIGFPQLELGGFATTVIPTTTAATTRAADTATMTGINFSSWYNPIEGTFGCLVDRTGIPSAVISYPGAFYVDDGTPNNSIGTLFGRAGAARILSPEAFIAGVNEVSIVIATSIVTNTYYNTALGYGLNNYAAVTNNGTLQTDVSASVPTVNTLRIGALRGDADGSRLNGRVARITYYPVRLPNTTLQALST